MRIQKRLARLDTCLLFPLISIGITLHTSYKQTEETKKNDENVANNVKRNTIAYEIFAEIDRIYI